MTMKRIFAALAFFPLALALLSPPSSAQVANGAVTTAAPTYTNGTNRPLSLDTAGSLRVDCASGCSGGSFNNNSDNVATSATNGQAAAWLYAFDGAAWDRLRVDGSTNLLVALGTAIPAGSNIIGNVRIDQTTPGTTNGVQITGGSLAANQSVNVAQINGVTPLMGAGNTGTGSPRVTVATDQAALAAWGQGATGAAVPSGAQYNAVNVGGNLTGLVGNPCQVNAHTYAPIDIVTATTTRIITPTASQRAYICGMFLLSAGTNNVALVEGTGGTCGSSTAGILGGATAAEGQQLTAQAGFVMPTTGYAQAASAGTNVDVCLITSAAIQLSGVVVYVKAP